MFGYATDETEECMPLTIILAHRLNARMAALRRSGLLPWLRPDSKTQVSPPPPRGSRHTPSAPPFLLMLFVVKIQTFSLGTQRIVDFQKSHLWEKSSAPDVFFPDPQHFYYNETFQKYRKKNSQ